MILTHLVFFFLGEGGTPPVTPPAPDGSVGGLGKRRPKRPQRRGRHVLPDGTAMFGTMEEYAERILELQPGEGPERETPVLPAEVRRQPPAATQFDGALRGPNPFDIKPEAVSKGVAAFRNAVKAPNLDAEDRALRYAALRVLLALQQDDEDAAVVMLLWH